MARIKQLIAEAHRRSIWQVLGIYLVGSSAAWQVIAELTERVGLPEWVPLFAVVLFVIGLPIVIATAFVQEGPQAPTTPPQPFEPLDPTLLPQSESQTYAPQSISPSPSPSPSPWPLTWKRAVFGGICAFLLLGITAGGYMGMRNAGIGPFGSLVAKGTLDNRERVLLAEFSGVGTDSALTQAITQAFRISFEQSSVISVIDDAHVRRVLERMSRDPESHVTASLAREIAERDNIKAYVAGEVTHAGAAYIVAAKLLTPTGELLASYSSDATDATILDAVQKISKKLRSKIGESLRTLNQEAPLEAVTTPSLPALRKYAQGAAAYSASEIERSISLLKEAVSLDSTFAMAWRKLAVAYGAAGIAREVQIDAATHAYSYRDRLTPIERYQTIAYYEHIVTQDERKSADAYRSVLDINPDNYAALNNIYIPLEQIRAYDEATGYLQHAINVDPAVPSAWSNLVHALLRMNKPDSAATVLENWKTRGRVTPQYWSVYFDYAFMQEDSKAALAAVEQILEAGKGSQSWQTLGLWQRSLIYRAAGQLRRAEQDRSQLESVESDRDNSGMALGAALMAASEDLFVRRDPPRAAAHLDAILEKRPLDGLAPVDRPYLFLAILYALSGRPERARELLSEYERVVPKELRGNDERDLLAANASIAMQTGDSGRAIADFRKANGIGSCALCIEPFLAMAFETANLPDSAIVHYERYTDRSSLVPVDIDADVRAATRERLAELYEQQGNHAKAAKYAAEFVEQWKNADAELQPRVRAMQALLARD